MKNSSNVLYLQIAGFVIKIIFKRVKDFPIIIENEFKNFIKKNFSGFLINEGRADFIIQIDPYKHFSALQKKIGEFLFFIKKRTRRKIITFSHISQHQFRLILSLILNELLKNKGFILHASAVAFQNKAYIFMGQPGAGKSTIMKLLSKKFNPIADDSIIIKKENGSYFAYQTPFMEKEYWIRREKEKYEIGGMFFLKKSRRIKIEKIKTGFLARKLLNQLRLSQKNLILDTKLLLSFLLKNKNNIYYLFFPKNREILKFFITLVNKIFYHSLSEERN
jgi:hypothetical protein